MKTFFNLTTGIIVVFIPLFSFAQGCSDAGICTLNNLKPNSHTESNQIKIGLTNGKGDHSINILGNYIEYSKNINSNINIDFKLTSISQNGSEFSIFGLGDIYINSAYKIKENTKLIVGVKIPLSNGNTKKDNFALPMDFQSSLGTFDIILGTSYSLNKFQLMLGYQQPLTQNKNEFLAENHLENSLFRNFQSTNQFKRSGDILIRLAYPLLISNKIKFTPSILPIYHIKNDKFVDVTGSQKQIIGSQGLTLNGNVFLDYELTKKSALQLNFGIPFIVRESRPDGLTRSYAMNLEYNIKF